MPDGQSAPAAETAYIDADVASAVSSRAEQMGLRTDKLRRLMKSTTAATEEIST
jgi:3-methyladenine DNA glycosylase AlkD